MSVWLKRDLPVALVCALVVLATLYWWLCYNGKKDGRAGVGDCEILRAEIVDEHIELTYLSWRGKLDAVYIVKGTPTICPNWFENESNALVRMREDQDDPRIEHNSFLQDEWREVKVNPSWPGSAGGGERRRISTLDATSFKKSIYWRDPLCFMIHRINTLDIPQDVLKAISDKGAFIIADFGKYGVTYCYAE